MLNLFKRHFETMRLISYFKSIQKEREREMRKFAQIVPKLEKVYMTEKYFPIIFFEDSLIQYSEGFDVVSIFSASLAVELALLILVGRKTNKPEKLKPFEALIKSASESEFGILTSDLADIANNVRLMRNCYVHYYNLLYYSFIELEKAIESGKRLLEDSDEITKKFIEIRISKIQEQLNSFGKGIPKLSIVNDKEVRFMEKRIDLFYEFLSKDKKRFIEFFTAANKVDTKMPIVSYDKKRFDAKTQIEWVYQILKYLKIIP